jgi:hypothetical protein
MKKLILTGVLAALGVAAMAQINAPSVSGRTFAYDGTAFTNGAISLEFNGTGFYNAGWQPGVYDNTDLVAVIPDQVAWFKAVTRMRVKTYLYIAGTFSGEFTVNGYGESNNQDITRTNSITVLTNRSLRVVPYYFTALRDEGQLNGPDYGNVTYTMSWSKPDGLGGKFNIPSAGSITGTDHFFNGQTLDLNLEYVDPGHNGQFYLEFDRKLIHVSEKAQGGRNYSTTGVVTFTVLN